jgi:hypothetical protein
MVLVTLSKGLSFVVLDTVKTVYVGYKMVTRYGMHVDNTGNVH